MNWRTWMSSALVAVVICGCHIGQKSYAQSGLPKDPAAYFPKDAGSSSSVQMPQGSGSGKGAGGILYLEDLKSGGANQGSGSGKGSSSIDLTSGTSGGGSIGEVSARVWATVNGNPILETELLHAMFPANLIPPSDPDYKKKLREYTKMFLERLIDIELLTHDMNQRFGSSPAGKRTLDKLKDMADREFEGVVHNEIKSWRLKSEEDYKSFLSEHNITYEGRRRYIQRGMIAEEFCRYLVQGALEQIGQRQIYTYYQEHPDEFTPQVDTFDWEDIFLDLSKYPQPQRQHAQARAIDIAHRLQQGAKIDELLEFDDGDSRSRNGRGAGTHRGQIRPSEVEPELVRLTKDGEVGRLVVLQTGIHIIRLVHRENANELRPFDESAQKLIREKLQREIFERERKRILDNLRRKAQIEYMDP